ncbi:MAG: ATP-binding protein [Steroidobacteraceae bacterium]
MMAKSPPSVSRRLLIAVAVPLLLFFAFTVVALDTEFRHLTAVALRQELEEQVIALVNAIDPDGNGNLQVHVLDPDNPLDETASGQYAALRDARGRLLWRSPSLIGTGLELGTNLPMQEGIVYQRARDGSVVAELSRRLHWSIGTGPTKITKTFIFSAADSTAPQMRLLWTFRRDAAGWFGALALALLGTMAWMMRRALSPVRRLEQEIEAVETGAAMQLGGGYPRELAGVTEGLNALLESERNRIRRYRDTLGNLAHGLKTPLAVIRASLGVTELPATGTTGTTGTALALTGPSAAIQFEIDRMAQIVEHQLKRAAAGGGATLGQTPVPVLPLVTELRVALLKVHSRKDLRIEVDVPPELGFLGDGGDILELLGNILDNACKWCRSRVALSARLDPDRVLSQRLSIVVDDDGPGIDAGDRERVIERGVRASEHVPGHGLGLAIVHETVGLYGGRFYIDASPTLGGARVELLLPGR